MSLAAIRESRQVPAKRGMRCRVDGKPGVITGARFGYVQVRFDGRSFSVSCHPTWRFEYINKDGTVSAFGMDPAP